MVRILTQSLKIITIVMVAVFAVGGSIWFFDYWQERASGHDAGRPVIVRISEEDTSGDVADKLTDAGLVRFGWYFELRMRLADVSLQPGTYTLRNGTSVTGIVDTITTEAFNTGEGNQSSGNGGGTQAFEVTLIEGQRAEQFGEAIEAAGYPDGRQVFMDAVRDPAVREEWDFLDNAPADASINGFLFPDTYTFTTDFSGEDMVDRLLGNFDKKVTPDMRQHFADQGLSLYDAITVASIVEREAVVTEERPTIAAVYLNRLQQDMPLQADPTSQYALGEPGNWWPAEMTEEELHLVSPYNTYDGTGLPPSPISNPGLASIQAVAQPADVDYLFFFAKQDGSGEHLFASTYEQHQQNICSISAEACAGASRQNLSGIASQPLPPDLASRPISDPRHQYG